MKKPQNYYLEVITPTQAEKLFTDGKTEIYKLFDDDTESLVLSAHDLQDAIELKIELGIERKI